MASIESSAQRKARLDYQNKYNYVKRTGRRKMGKVQRRREECRRRAMVNSTRKPYSNSFTVKDINSHDPLRTPLMANEERLVTRECIQVRGILRSDGTELDDEHYVQAIRARLDEALCEARSYLRDTEDVDVVQVHRYRRRIAGYSQIIELVEQGSDAEHYACLDESYIFSGRRVNRRVFKQVYGF
ncbi:hypothetical protein FA95DRAFT_1611863 [Auriscalpium vulgare]|uniref:Uncharacterized protein n=1 Tax=Auriscalpium vulgare TaxID=40419 RepID=A0ACB8R9U3_9AGAM|nr:hypothetical protein FA95DRAFT_1611863 [Auriscalpium vulgare]